MSERRKSSTQTTQNGIRGKEGFKEGPKRWYKTLILAKLITVYTLTVLKVNTYH